ncbi:MAG: pilus assembly protein PilM [Patescibacteria group bacterium]
MNFLSLKTEAFGLDINESDLKIVKLRKKSKFFELSSFKKVTIKSGVIEAGEIKNEDALTAIIKEAQYTVDGEKLNTKYVVASLPEEKSFLQVIQMPKMNKKELQSAIFFEAENYIPLPIGQVYLDFEVINPAVDHLNHLDVLIVAMPRVVVDSYASCIKKAGLTPVAFEVQSEAIARALVKNQTSDSQLILLDIGKNNVCFTVFAGCSIRFTSSISIFGKTQNDLEKFAEQVEKYLNFYQDHSSHEHLSQDNGVEKIILCGDGAGLNGLSDFLSKRFAIKTELGNPWINIPSKKINDAFGKKFLAFTTALGLALRGANGET